MHMNGSWLYCLQALVPSVLLLEDEHDETIYPNFKPDVTAMKDGAICIKVESKKNELLMETAESELVSKFHPQVVQIFPRERKGIIGMICCPTLINVYGTPNNHYVTWMGATIVKEFKTSNKVRNERIRNVYENNFPNIEWGTVINDKMISISRIGRLVSDCRRNNEITKEQISKGILAGLEQLHSIGLAHTDISITNSFVDKDGVVFIVDLEYLTP
eukprot:gene9143-12329_t